MLPHRANLLQWIANVCYTVIGRDFADWVREQIEARNVNVASKRDLYLDVDPQIAAVIAASTAVSTQKGSAAMLMKTSSKRKRTRAEMEEFRAQGDQQQRLLNNKDERIGYLESQLHDSKSKLQAAQGSQELVQQLIQAGVLLQQEDGSFNLKQD